MKAKSSYAASPSPPGTGAATTSPAKRSPSTAGFAPATSATSTGDGFLHITGRIKEIVIRGGENISPIEIENVAYRHPAVKEVAVFGVADDAMGEELALVCYPQPGSVLTEPELREHLLSALPAFQGPEVPHAHRRTAAP